MSAAREELKAALKRVNRAAFGDSNDNEIAQLGLALDLALTRWPGLERSFEEPEGMT